MAAGSIAGFLIDTVIESREFSDVLFWGNLDLKEVNLKHIHVLVICYMTYFSTSHLSVIY